MVADLAIFKTGLFTGGVSKGFLAWRACAIDELTQADTDYAAGNTVSGEELRRRYGLVGLTAYLACATRMVLVVGVLATAVAFGGGRAVTAVRRLLPHVSRVGGAVLVIAGLYVGYHDVYELRLEFDDGGANAPVIGGPG